MQNWECRNVILFRKSVQNEWTDKVLLYLKTNIDKKKSQFFLNWWLNILDPFVGKHIRFSKKENKMKGKITTTNYTHWLIDWLGIWIQCICNSYEWVNLSRVSNERLTVNKKGKIKKKKEHKINIMEKRQRHSEEWKQKENETKLIQNSK